MPIFGKKKKGKAISGTMSPADEKVRKLSETIDKMVEKSDEAQDEWLSMYRTAICYTFGDQLSFLNLKSGWEAVQCNYLYPAWKQTSAIITQQKTRPIARPPEDSDRDSVETVEGYLHHLYNKKLNIPGLRARAITDGFLAGVYAAYVRWEEQPEDGWNEEKRDYEGSIECDLLPCGDFGGDGRAEFLDRKHAEYVFVRRDVPVEWAKSQSPANAEEIERAATKQAEQEEKDSGTGVPKLRISGSQEAATQDGTTYSTGQSDAGEKHSSGGRIAELILNRSEREFVRTDGTDKPASVTMVEIWFKDRDKETVSEKEPIETSELLNDGTVFIDPDSGRVLFSETNEPLTEANRPVREIEYERPKFPNGRYVKRIGNVILNPDEADQRWQYKEWPVFVAQFGQLPHTWNGMNGVEPVKGLQDAMNHTVVHMLNVVKYFSDPAWIVEEGAVKKPKSGKLSQALKVGAGRIIKALKGGSGGIKRVEGSSVPQGLFNVQSFFDQQTRNQTGIQDVLQGIGGKSETATEALRLETNSRVQITLLLTELDDWTVRIMRWVSELVKEHVDVGEFIRVVGEDKAERVVEVQEGDFDVDYDVDLEVGTALPFDEERKKQEALNLVQVLGEAYIPRLLEAFDVHHPGEVLDAHQLLSQLEALNDLEPEAASKIKQELASIIQEAVATAESEEGEGTQAGEPPQQPQQTQGQPQEGVEAQQAYPGQRPEEAEMLAQEQTGGF